MKKSGCSGSWQSIILKSIYLVENRKKSGELYAKNLLKNKRSLKRILPDFFIGAHAELYSHAFVTWNPSDYNINKDVMTPIDVMREHDTT